MRLSNLPFSLPAATALVGFLLPAAAHAATDGDIARIEARIRSLQGELDAVRKGLAARKREVDRAVAAAAEARREAREANRRAVAAAGARSFAGIPAGSGFEAAGFAGSGGTSIPAGAVNGLGGHSFGTAGAQKASPIGEYGHFRLGGVTVTIGGFLDATAVVRSRNIVGDVSTTWNSIPYASSPLYHESEFRGSARNSRLALLVEGQPSAATRVAGYYEADFKVAGISSNSNESNSYALGLRQAYASVDRSDWGLHVLGGQAWSLITLNRVGIVPRQEQIPLTIDSAYVPGFNWTRNAQLRIAKDFDHQRIWAAVSLESPESTYYVNNANNTGVVGGTPNYANPGGSLLNANANYSDDIAPDVIAKIAFDPSFGHYEIYGVARFLHDRVVSTVPDRAGRDNTVLAGGGGAGLILPLLGPELTFQASGLVGTGIGRYGEAQLPDATIGRDGSPVPIPEAQLLLGLVWHPTKAWDLYAYAGTEQAAKRSYNETAGGKLTPYGYGNGLYVDAGCGTEGSTLACVGNTRGITQGTLGAWWRFLHGPFGTLQAGTQWSYTRRTAFEGTGAAPGTTVTPRTDENVVMFSFRYLPFL